MSVNEMPAFLTDEQIDQMSQEEFVAYFENMKAAAARRNIPIALPTKSHSAGATTIEQVLSRAGILARAQSAADAANARVAEVKATYDTALASYMTANNLTELPEATANQIADHVKTTIENAKSGYKKVSEANKGKPKRKGSLEVQAEAEGNTAETVPDAPVTSETVVTE